MVQPDTRIPFKRFTRNELSYMDKPEMEALLATPDRRTVQGLRDHGLLLFLYNVHQVRRLMRPGKSGSTHCIGGSS